MTKLKFTSGGKEIDLNPFRSTAISANRKGLYRILSAIGFLTFLAYILAIPVFFYIDKGITEQRFVQLGIFLAVFLLFLTLGKIVLAGSKILVDTPLLMTILLFALLTVGAYLMSSTNVRNTFGLPAVKYLAGSVIMSSLGIYYFGILFTNTARKLTLIKYAVLLVPIALAGIYLSNLLIAVSSIRIVSLFIPVYLLGVIYLQDKKLKILSLIGLILTSIINLKYGFTSYISIAVIAEFGMVLIVVLAAERLKVFTKLGESLKSIKTVIATRSIKPLSNVAVFWIVAVVGAVYFALTTVWFVQNHQILIDFLSSIQTDFNAAMLTLKGLGPTLIGNGANLPLRTTSYATELQFQGLIGLGGHILLAVSVIYLAGRRFFKFLKDRDLKFNELFILFPVFVGLAVAATLSLLTQMESMIWWICLAVIGAEIIIDQRSFVSDLLQKLHFKAFIVERRAALLQIVILVTLAVVFVYLASLLNLQITRGLL